MRISVRSIGSFGLMIGSFALVSCVRSTVSNEKTNFTHIDSLTETYLTLQDSLLHSWHLLAKDEDQKLKAIENTINELVKLSPSNIAQLVVLKTRLNQLKEIHITQKTLSNPDVVEEYDFASNSLISEVLSIADANPALLADNQLSSSIEKIKVTDQRVLNFRLTYDSIANEFNAFLEKNKGMLKEIDNSTSLEKRPIFNTVFKK